MRRNLSATGNKVFKDQIGHNMKVYVDDMLIKNHASGSHVSDLEKTFTIPQISYEVEYDQMHLRSEVEVPRIHGVPSKKQS